MNCQRRYMNKAPKEGEKTSEKEKWEEEEEEEEGFTSSSSTDIGSFWVIFKEREVFGFY
jgi:hypothetical protein